MKYFYDTNIFIDYLSGVEDVQQYFDKDFLANNELFISSIVRIELLSYPELSINEEKVIREVLDQFVIIPLNDDIVEMTILLRKKYKLKVPDSIIASSVIYIDSMLITRDLKDFGKVSELSIFSSDKNRKQ